MIRNPDRKVVGYSYYIALVPWWNSAKLIWMDDPSQTDQTVTDSQTSPVAETPPAEETPPTPIDQPTQNPEPQPAPHENPPDISNPPEATPSAAVMPPPAETIVPEPSPQPEEPAPKPVDVPIPNFHFPFNGSFPVTFAFNATATTDEMKAKFSQWGISGHHGVDFGLPEGTEVVAVDFGKVILSGPNGDYGNCVIIQHSWGQSLYAHLKETKVNVDQNVNPGDVLGASGQTGAAFGPHLHFGLKPNNSNESNGYLGFIDPTPYLPQISQSSQTPQPEPEKPEAPKPPVENPVPDVSEPTIDIEPVIPSPQPSNPSIPPEPVPIIDDSEIQKRAEEILKEKQETFRLLGNQAKTQQHEDNIKKIIVYAQEKKQIDNQQVRDLLHVSQSTATNYLTELVNKGILRIDKKAKATVYLY